MDSNNLLVLVSEIRDAQAVLTKTHLLYKSYQDVFKDESKRDVRDAVLLAEILCNSYTCIETILFRISRAFENHLDSEGWHKQLLRKMRLEIPGIRKAVLYSFMSLQPSFLCLFITVKPRLKGNTPELLIKECGLQIGHAGDVIRYFEDFFVIIILRAALMLRGQHKF